MAIGPELPPHLAKRKRGSDAGESDSGGEKRKRTIGPSLLPRALSNPDAIDLDAAESTDDEGPVPTLPAGPTKPRVIGPAMPPVKTRGDSPHEAGAKAQESESDSDGDIGPAPPPAGVTISASQRPLVMVSKTGAQQDASPRPQRDDWMLAAPSGGDWTARVDPTKMRSRKFNSNARPAASSSASGAQNLWSETPEQKRQRLQNQVLGVQAPEEGESSQRSTGPRKSKEDEEKERRIRDYNEKKRGPSLFEQHRGKQTEEEEDDPSKRAFDREKDIAGGTRLSHAKKREMMGRAADFGSRFAKGPYL